MGLRDARVSKKNQTPTSLLQQSCQFQPWATVDCINTKHFTHELLLYEFILGIKYIPKVAQ